MKKMKRMYKVVFLFYCSDIEKITTEFVTAWNKTLALDVVKSRYGRNAVYFPQIEFVETY